MEYVKVIYPQERSVYVDGGENGSTNTSIRVDEGTHVFDLGEPKDYAPESQEVAVEGTTMLKPMEIAFQQVEIS